MSENDDYRCCALPEGHDGCCAYRCSDCDGRPKWHMSDDLGCLDDCGCDGDGYCPECSGMGWFNEFGEPCVVTADDLKPKAAS